MEVADAAATGGDVASRSSGSYDVFLSCVGTDIRRTIEDLVEAGIGAFRDYNELEDAGEIDGELLRVIDGAKIYIPIFSTNYARSVCILKKLAAMVERMVKSGRGKTILPLFFGVEPRDVSLETPLYRDDLVKLVKRIGSKEAKAWADALKGVGSLPGWKMRYGW